MEASTVSLERRCHELTAEAASADEHHALFKSAALERESGLESQLVRHQADRSALVSRMGALELVVSAACDAACVLSDAHCASSAEARSSVSEAMRLACVADQQRMALESTLRAFRVCGSRMSEIGWLWVRGSLLANGGRC
jgi:hypothetical protein